jgi:serine phosphatase RsbU (regulator of sigma subunit)
MRAVNTAFFPDLVQSELLVSAFYAEIDLATRTVSFCRAGHPKPLLLQGNEVLWLDTEGLLLGVREDPEFEERSVRLSEGDAIVLYTDGLMEAHDGDDSCFGLDGLCRAAAMHRDLPPGRMAVSIIDEATAHSGDAPPADDMTALCVRLGGGAGEGSDGDH